MDGVIPPNIGGDVHLWNLYCDLKKGCDEITYSDIVNYMAVTGTMLTPLEAGLMIDIDLRRRSKCQTLQN